MDSMHSVAGTGVSCVQRAMSSVRAALELSAKERNVEETLTFKQDCALPKSCSKCPQHDGIDMASFI